MRMTIPVATAALVVVVMATHAVTAQRAPDIWRSFAERVEVGSELNVRLNDGTHFRATLVAVRSDAMLVQPKTRVPVPIQAVPFEQIVRVERAKPGVGAAKAVAIGVATGVGTFFGILALLLGVAGD